jgi:outer membrane protein OmpA-like peptidoglycan-associated protein/tetratricopeptide (TPR) repeat protein
MRILILVFIFAFLGGFKISAQSASLRSINKLYYAKLYSQAIPKYLAMLKKDSMNAEVLANLADCYRLTNNINGQLVSYGRLVQSGKAEEIHKVSYGKALMTAGRYEEAKKIFEDCKTDKVAEASLKAIAKLGKFSKDADAYKIDTVNFNTKYNDFSAVNLLNEKVVFTSNDTKTSWITKRHGWTDNQFCDIYSVAITSEGKYGEKKTYLKELNSKFNDGPICFSVDGKTVFFTRNSFDKKGKSIDGSQKLKIFQANIEAGKLTNIMPLKVNSNEFNCAHPAVSYDGKTLFFSSDMGGGQGGMDIWYCKLGADGAWGSPINLGDKINTSGHEVFPTTANDGVLYFASNGNEGLGGLDIYEVKIKEDKPGKVYNMGKPVNTEFDDFSYSIYADGKKAFLSSNRQNGSMDDDIYAVDILRKVVRGKTCTIDVKDKESKESLKDLLITINKDTIKVNEEGKFQYVLEEDISYTLTVINEKYEDYSDTLSTKSSNEDEFVKTVDLAKKSSISLFAGIYDAKTGEGIENVKITFKDAVSDSVFYMVKTEKNGEYRKLLSDKKVGDKLNYKVIIEKDKYLTKTVDFKFDITKEGEIQLNELLNLTIGKVEVGMDLAKMIDIKPIYFDLGKNTIRKDAAEELNKIVAIMKEFPGMEIELGSHTDCRGAAAANLKLSDTRAKVSAAYIVKNGIDVKRVKGKGYGESRLLNDCACEGKVKPTCPEADHAKNRRTEFIILKITGSSTDTD